MAEAGAAERRMATSSRALRALRALMAAPPASFRVTPLFTDAKAALAPGVGAGGLAAVVVPTADAHQSEYVAACDARRAFLSGFTGSAGTGASLRAAAPAARRPAFQRGHLPVDVLLLRSSARRRFNRPFRRAQRS